MNKIRKFITCILIVNSIMSFTSDQEDDEKITPRAYMAGAFILGTVISKVIADRTSAIVNK